MCRLLTVLNFGDTSPLMVFGRAILLGITAKGDPTTCFSAYPTCPRDPDRLVDYLNNHNGGFFRFFGTRRPNHPSHDLNRIQTGLSRFATIGRPQDIRGNRPHNFPHHISTSLKPPLPPAHQDPDIFRREVSTSRLSFVFPSNGHNRQSKGFKLFKQNGTENSSVNTVPFLGVDNSKPELHIERPFLEQKKPAIPMTFPDRTGTGDLRLDINDVDRPVISNSSFSEFESQNVPIGFTSNRKYTLKFPQNRGKSGTMKFPTTSHDTASGSNRNQKQFTSLKFP